MNGVPLDNPTNDQAEKCRPLLLFLGENEKPQIVLKSPI